jgi:D-apionolactonase
MPMVSEPERAEPLRIGRASFLADGGEVRYLMVDDTELVRRIHVAVRDTAWATREPDETRTEIELGESEIVISTASRHESDDVAIDWTIEARIRPSGEVVYTARFDPLQSFPFARIGICVLLPPAALIGRRYRARTEAGETEGAFSVEIAPQWIDEERIFPLFDSFSDLWIETAAHDLELSFAGDLFEVEDQRNWSDGSFKIYGTPLSQPRPQQAEVGRPVMQRLRLLPRRRNPPATGRSKRAGEIAEIKLGSAMDLVVPGFGITAAAATATPVAGLGLTHIHLGLDHRCDDGGLAEAAALAAAAEASLHVAVRIEDEADLAALAALLSPFADLIAWVLAFDRAGIGAGELIRVVRDALAPTLPRTRFAGGTDLAFADLNRARPNPDGLEGITWGVDPQVHSTDALTTIEAIAPQADQVSTAASFAPRVGALVGPVELRPPSSLGTDAGARFATAWTTASFATLAAAGALAVTYGRGLPAQPLGAWRGRKLLRLVAEEPLAVVGLAVADDGAGAEVLLVNLRDAPTDVRIVDGGPTIEINLAPHEVRTALIPPTQEESKR